MNLDDSFFCPGYHIVEDRRIRCHKVGGHGSENFVQGLQNSCNPVFMQIGLELGVERFYDYFHKLGLTTKTGVDLPGEASTIFSDYTNSAGNYGKFHCEWGNQDHAPFRCESSV